MKTKLSLIVLLFSFILPLSLAHAYVDNPYAELYAVGSDGSTTFQSTFSYSQQPWLFIEFYNPPTPSILHDLTLSVWTNTSTNTSYTLTALNTKSNEVWLSVSPSKWNTIKAAGTWDTSEISFNTPNTPAGNSAPFVEQASFKVNAAPEPPGTVLFLVGALLMGIYLLRRKKAIVA